LHLRETTKLFLSCDGQFGAPSLSRSFCWRCDDSSLKPHH